ncbi:MAG TPA: ribonuclease catalytic domain-containing protein [Rectinemataceae bacterium]|nr:ribonuclease catalytic domain-containing protein [Rectinemataceae bacterium]
MFKPQSIALYKNRPVLVADIRDKIEIRLDDGATLRVRDKDLTPLHSGPVKVLPPPAEGGDFDTAWRMLAPPEESAELSGGWEEMAELVFGSAGPAEVLACWKETLEGLRFRLEDGRPAALSESAAARELERRTKKEGEASERAAFVERARRARAKKRSEAPDRQAAVEEAAGAAAAQPGGAAAQGAASTQGAASAGLPPPFEPGDERFVAEIEALALGRSAKSRLCSEIGISESPEDAHAYLLAAGLWNESNNPHPARAACPTWAPKIVLVPNGSRSEPTTGPVEAPARFDATGLVSWAIDNAWSKDPDDAVAWDGSRVWVHVADPASLILPDSEADREALGRGSTLYLPELTSPMLPDEALERFGLGLSETSPALSFRIGVDAEGAVADVEVMVSTVRVRRVSYGEADELMAGGAADLQALAGIAEVRRARRLAHGAVEIDIPEVRVHVERFGPEAGSIRVDPVPRDRSSAMVREMMLLAGEAAARWAFERGLPFPFYSQESPGEAGAAAEGETLSAQFARRRLMRSGISGPTPGAHRGLGLPFYAQATSPLRRYQDLLGHMQLRAFLAGRPFLDADEIGRRCALAQAASAATRQAERSSELHWTLAYLKRAGSWKGEGFIVGAGGPGSWQVYIPSLGLETKLKLGAGRKLDERLELSLARLDLARLECSFDELR